MESHFELSDSAFVQQFQTCRLDPSLFTHEAHLRLAWIHVSKYGAEQAIETINRQLLAFVDSLGVRHKYNKTLTIAAIKAVDHFRNKSEADNFPDFIEQFPKLKHSFKQLISCHYQVDIYNSEQAKQTYIEPDLMPFD